ncbi:MAG TPA: Wzz/FepE/Etk N-terminal domain-containing protein [Pyrinomonadaceae bacterium]|nr:Wzz/FepE/Etk N-terminal domain-containing protein [Pyrinomonadaceae bacterium]
MSVEFRQRKPGELIGIVKRQKWLIILPMITMTAAIGYVVYRLPSIYESTSLLTVKPPTISSNLVQSLSNEDLSQRLTTISQEVLSRSSLEPMVQKYDLYKVERGNGVPMELIIEKMYKNIVVKVDETNDKVAAFRISYRDRDPQAARNVAADLASKYVNAQVQNSVEIAESTNELFEKQLTEKKEAMDELEKQRLDIMMANVATLPESEQGLVAQLQGLRQRDDTIAKDRQSLFVEKGRLSDSIAANNRQMRLIEDFGQKETQDTARATTIEDTPAYGELTKRRAELQAQLDTLKKVYKDKFPAVVAKQAEIDRLNEEFDNLRKNSDKRVQNVTQATSRKSELQKKSLELENERIQSQIGQIEQQLSQKDVDRQQNAAQIAALEARINSIPNVKVALEGVNGRFASAKATYDEILKKKNDVGVNLDVETQAKGETIRVQDPANVPQSPVAPKRFVLTLVGTGVGFLFGLFLAAFFEIPRLFKIQNIEDAKHYTGLPVLASVPPLLSADERKWIKRSYWLKLAAGLAAAIGVIPIIILILQATRIFDRLVS